MDKFKDFYNQEPNYTRLFLLFVLFLVSIYYYVGGDTYGHDVDYKETPYHDNYVAPAHTG